MNKIARFTKTGLFLLLFQLFSLQISAQGPGGVPDDPSLPGTGGDATNGAVGHPAGGGAPISSGILVLLSLGAVYGAYKYNKYRHRES